MADSRIRQQIARLLDEAERAFDGGDWAIVRDRAEKVLRLDPDNADGRAYLAAANETSKESGPFWPSLKRRPILYSFGSIALLVVVVAAGGLVAAGLFDSTQPEPATSAVIGAQGGKVSVTDEGNPLRGATLDVPPGALQGNVTITIAPTNAIEGPPSTTPTIELGPSGTIFSKPVLLTIPYPDHDDDGLVDGTDSTEGSLQLWYHEPDANAWLPLETSVDETTNTATAKISHFSAYRIFAGKFEKDTTVTYAFRSLPDVLDGYSGEDFKAAVRRAFQTWSQTTAQVAGVRLVESSGPLADIYIYAGPPKPLAQDSVAWVNCIDNCWHSAAGAISITFLRDGPWAAPPFVGDLPLDSWDTEAVALHEVGHALGLHHFGETPCTAPPLMCHQPLLIENPPGRAQMIPMRCLAMEDVNAFAVLYGIAVGSNALPECGSERAVKASWISPGPGAQADGASVDLAAEISGLGHDDIAQLAFKVWRDDRWQDACRLANTARLIGAANPQFACQAAIGDLPDGQVHFSFDYQRSGGGGWVESPAGTIFVNKVSSSGAGNTGAGGGGPAEGGHQTQPISYTGSLTLDRTHYVAGDPINFCFSLNPAASFEYRQYARLASQAERLTYERGPGGSDCLAGRLNPSEVGHKTFRAEFIVGGSVVATASASATVAADAPSVVQPPIAQPPAVQPPPDSDGDGIRDGLDECPNVAGPPERSGCPQLTIDYYALTLTIEEDEYSPGDEVDYCYRLTPENVPFTVRLYAFDAFLGQWNDNGIGGGDCLSVPINSEASPGLRTLYMEAYVDSALVAEASASFEIVLAGAPPAPPSGLFVDGIGGESFIIDWFDNSDNETGFELVDCVPAFDASDCVFQVFLNPNEVTYIWWEPNLNYKCFAIRAYNQHGHSAWTPYACHNLGP